MPRRRAPVAVLLLLGTLLAGVAPADTGRRWDFRVTLDDQPIGDHRFSSTASSGSWPTATAITRSSNGAAIA